MNIEEWARKLKAHGYETPPDDPTLTRLAQHQSSISWMDVQEPGFRPELERALERQWRKSAGTTS